MTNKNTSRPSGRSPKQLRDITITPGYTKHAEGSVLVEFGETKVLCTASVTDRVPRFLKDADHGWVTAEYGMLPRSTHTRCDREASRGKQGGRTVEIQRLIGRSLRAAINLKVIRNYSITIDCDVIQADGGTRTAAITGGCTALAHAINYMENQGMIKSGAFKHWVAAVSAGIYQGEPVLDLDYDEDCKAETDMNFVMTDEGGFIELQGTAEKAPFSNDELMQLLELAKSGINQLIELQTATLA